MGLEFCATLLTNVSVCSFSCTLLCSGCEESGRGQVPGGHCEGGGLDRLFCVAGTDTGFVQAWELSLDGGKDGVGGQPLWAQKVL